MPPRKSRRRLEKSSDEEPASELQNAVQDNVRLAQLPAELFDAIIEDYTTLPLAFYYDTHDIPALKYYERNDVLTALSQTCRALREVTLPRLWARLDICRVPEKLRATWYKYTMLAIERKAKGIADSPVRHHVRTLTLMFSKSKPDAALAALWKMLPNLPNLRTIQVITCKTPGFAKSLTDSKLELPNVTALYIPDQVSVFQKICPNVTHVCCAGGQGAALLSALTLKTEIVDGMIDWKNLQLVDRLVKKAPNLLKLELRRPVNNGLSILSQNSIPADEWKQIIPKLAALKKLRELVLTFPSKEDHPGDAAVVEVARSLVRDRLVAPGERKLVVRHIVALHYEYAEMEEDTMTSCTVECFE
ncbi:hypothetical protein R3P38DRAFT_2858782 [Favolaschia claudopus]|uniref:F-box domain-containing protein n=1 Tax=Favolaschia claudopus TaxID=2862362 RepID=A0AAW0DK24_9AGAR